MLTMAGAKVQKSGVFRGFCRDFAQLWLAFFQVTTFNHRGPHETDP
jgi:hypothetical protein